MGQRCGTGAAWSPPGACDIFSASGGVFAVPPRCLACLSGGEIRWLLAALAAPFSRSV